MAEIGLAWVQQLESPEPKFSLGSIIAYGDTAVVYEGTDSDGQKVAIKVLDETEESIPDIHNEFQTLSEACRENPSKFPIFFGAYRSIQSMPYQIWFVMELCEEGSVKDLLLRLKARERFLKEDIIAYILREVLQGLKDLHERSIIHRNVKSSNILICKNGDIKLCDFGFATNVGTPQGKVQAVIGSPYWMAPEVVTSDRHPDFAYDSRVDVWSLGITAAELGANDAPNSHVYPPRALFQVVQNPPPALHKPSDWTQLFIDFIAECLEKNPDHRPWSSELIEHTFITDEVANNEDRIRGSLLHLLNEVKGDPPPDPEPEVTVKSEMIKMDRTSAPRPMYRDDIATLFTVSEESVMDTLSQRFAQGNIYTFLGDVLLSINPFHEYPVYGSEVAMRYKFRARNDEKPHIYAVGDRAYQDMLHHQEVQNIILTGETGSGKTTSGKHLLWHLANMTASNKKMVERMLKVSSVIEAFGNASTIFNSNSTRHIQYLELTFTKTGKLSGGILWAYCLEKWRVTNCGRNQSNFHIFYYLMDTLIATDQMEKYHLDKGKNYDYLPSSPSHAPQTNIEKLSEIKEAFNILDFSLEEQDTIVKVLCAILLMGQIHFHQGEDEVEIQNPEVVEKIAELLQVDDKKLKWTFTNYCVVTGGEPVRGKNNFDEAEETKHGLARTLYCRLTDWIVNLINTKLSFTRLVFGDSHSLGILDIPGFECFAQDNTLDQFLVNMTNEQMQFFYNQRVFIWEMHDYEKDELPQAGYNFHDNRELLDITLSKPNGLLFFLDEETKSAGNDHKRFLDQIDSKLETRFIRVTDVNNFTVFHYSGQVTYDARNFVERNKNFLSPEVIQVLRESGSSTITQLFSNQMTKTGNLVIADEDIKHTRWTSALSAKPHQHKKFNTKSRGKYSQSRQMQTIAATMRNSLLEMLQKVSEGSAHFVRCLRSNLKCTPFTFDRDLIRYQIRALGIMDTVRARQQGYSRRLKFPEFLRRYKFLAFDFDEHVEETKDNCRLLLIRLKMEGWALGKSRVFLKYYNEEFLSRLYESQVHKVVKIQSMMRAFLARKKTNSKFPRLAELRKQGSSDKVVQLAAIKKSLTSSWLTKGSSPVVEKKLILSPHKTHKDEPPLYSSSITKASTPNYGYTKIYSSKNNSATTSAMDLQKMPNKPIRRSLSPPDSEIISERPASPRDIAKAFEAQCKENPAVKLGARNRSSSTAACSQYLSKKSSSGFKTDSSTGNQSTNDLKASSPEIINPLKEFTKYANKAMGDFDEPGPYNFQGMLRKTTNAKIRPFDETTKTPPPISKFQPTTDEQNNKFSSTTVAADSLKHKLTADHKKAYPLPGMTSNSDTTLNNKNQLSAVVTSNKLVEKIVSGDKIQEPCLTKNKRNVEEVTLGPGIIIEGFVEDL